MGDLLQFSTGPRRGLRRGTSAIALYELGRATEATDPARAITAYERAIAGRPDLADAYNNLGRLLHDRAEHGLAESYYRLALCVNASVGLYWYNLGVSLEDQRRMAEAIDAYQCAIRLDGTMADAHFNLSRLYELVGRSCDDEQLLQRAVKHLVRYRDLGRRMNRSSVRVASPPQDLEIVGLGKPDRMIDLGGDRSLASEERT